MSFSIAGAILGALQMMAGAPGEFTAQEILTTPAAIEILSPQSIGDFDFSRFAPADKKIGVAKKVLGAVAGAAAAATVVRLSDAEHALAYYPLEARIDDSSVNFTERLAVKHGGMKFQLSAIKSNAGPGTASGLQSPAPNFRTDARKMKNIMPGYPQPPKIVIGLKVSY
ncbi:MAG: hypothetical protein HKP25_01935 [Marinicaulis sp.]|nr:hypothetical protein [Marinicaulis sp.]NNL87805.1 hypothetical protein [Marinicaulis sp.]